MKTAKFYHDKPALTSRAWRSDDKFAADGTRRFGAFAFASAIVAGLLVAIPQSATAAPSYYPSGPQNDVLITDVTGAGWEVCYEGDYRDSQVLYGSGGLLSELCTGDYLMLAGSFPADLRKFAALAAAPRADVLFDTGYNNTTTTHLANGTNWYFTLGDGSMMGGGAWGFVDAGQTPQKTSCDTASGGKPKSLCWHAYTSGLGSGYLLAGVSGIFATDHKRVVLQASAAPAPAPAPEPYVGPLPTGYSDRSPAIGDSVDVSGLRLGSMSSCSIDGIQAEVTSVSADGFTFIVPEGVVPGLKNLVIFSDYGRLTAQGAFTVTAKPTNPAVAVASAGKLNAGAFNGYVAVYALGHKGSTISWKIAGKWFKTTVTSDYQVFRRKTAAVGVNVNVDIYIDSVEELSKVVTAK
jgi:hypothetical protein